MEFEFAAGLQRANGLAGKAQPGPDLAGIERLVLPVHLVESALEQQVGGVVGEIVVRALAGERLRPGDRLGLENDGLAHEAGTLVSVRLALVAHGAAVTPAIFQVPR